MRISRHTHICDNFLSCFVLACRIFWHACQHECKIEDKINGCGQKHCLYHFRWGTLIVYIPKYIFFIFYLFILFKQLIFFEPACEHPSICVLYLQMCAFVMYLCVSGILLKVDKCFNLWLFFYHYLIFIFFFTYAFVPISLNALLQ